MYYGVTHEWDTKHITSQSKSYELFAWQVSSPGNIRKIEPTLVIMLNLIGLVKKKCIDSIGETTRVLTQVTTIWRNF